jgi:GTPase SAR1 family protein
MRPKQVTSLIVGDHIGETSLKNTLFNVFAEQKTEFKYLSHRFIYRNVYKNFWGQQFTYYLSTSAGREAFEYLRHLRYVRSQVILLVFHYNAKTSFENATTAWLEEIRQFAPKVPVVLVGVKDNYISASPHSIVEPSEAKARAKECGIDVFVECSLKNPSSINEVFKHALIRALASNEPTKNFAKELYLKHINIPQIENKFIAQAIEIAKLRRPVNVGHSFNALDKNILAKILFYTAKAQGCERDPTNAINLILKNVKEKKHEKWNQSITTLGKEKRIFCAENHANMFSCVYLKPMEFNTKEPQKDSQQKSGGTIS